MKRYPITPVPKPRMTRQDKWPNRPPKYKGKEWPRPYVKKYRNFENQIIAHKIKIPDGGSHIIFVIPMPKSWSEKKKEQMFDTPHRAENSHDIDNLCKSIMDSMFLKDGHIWDIHLTKIWGYEGEIIIK